MNYRWFIGPDGKYYIQYYQTTTANADSNEPFLPVDFKEKEDKEIIAEQW